MTAVPNYLVVVDDTDESALALRYAALRAKSSGGNIMLAYIVPKAEFLLSGGLQDMIAAEAQEAAEALLARKADEVMALSGRRPSLEIREGTVVDEVTGMLTENNVHTLILGAAAKGAPGPLVSHFSGERAGNLPCVVVIVPGGLDAEAIDRLA
ncbi:universal stress protein [Sphingosinicella soli]|uniref:Nucleotide-binding universal stress UspA family protein n=1 Tax=Sphingosinicella soli TaxID=333708 RepID=A0A7W7AZI3_9SPHN|nr:universal stress protein [Sphingosinicella soli]MBB4631241.1 nucleotide-binding universal stress UspA family protein [Sphingosinicella soli]